MMAAVSAETGETGGCHVISRRAPIVKVSAIITHISGKVGTVNLQAGPLICSSGSKPSKSQKLIFQTQSLNSHQLPPMRKLPVISLVQ